MHLTLIDRLLDGQFPGALHRPPGEAPTDHVLGSASSPVGELTPGVKPLVTEPLPGAADNQSLLVTLVNNRSMLRDSPEEEREQRRSYAYKLLTIGRANALSSRSTRAHELIMAAFDLAREHDFPLVACVSASVLFNLFSHNSDHREEYYYYLGQLKHYRSVAAQCEKLRVFFNAHWHLSPELRAQGEQLLADARYVQQRARSYQLAVLIGMGGLRLLDVQQEAEAVVAHCVRTEDSLGSYSIPASARDLLAFRLTRLYALVQLNRLASATVLLKAILRSTTLSPASRAKLLETATLLALREGDTDRAVAALHRWREHCESRRVLLEEAGYYTLGVTVTWLMENFAIPIGTVPPPVLPTFKRSWRGPEADRARFYHLLYLALQRIAVGRMADARRSLTEATAVGRASGVPRVIIFAGMLATITEQDFHRVAVCRHATRYGKKLLRLPLERAATEVAWEPYPFEELWEKILSVLPTKRYTKRKKK